MEPSRKAIEFFPQIISRKRTTIITPTIFYLLVKAISAGVTWKTEQDIPARGFDLSSVTEIAGAGVLAIVEDDSLHSEQPLWLVENQAMFNRLD